MRVAVIVPTVNRADVLPELVDNIRATTEAPHRIYLVMEDWDTDSTRASGGLDTVDVIGRFGSNATAVNGGYAASTEPFLAVLNDDVRCTPGWDTAALRYMNDDTHIVGINQGNGVCSCFFMVRRAYIREHSGVFDRPDTLYHPYVSQFPDTEFAEYAAHRGVYAEATDAVVEHLHWVFGKADRDHVNYAKARATHDGDLATFRERQRRWR